MAEKQKQRQVNDFTYIAIYFLTFITGIIFSLISKGDKRKRQHSIQAIVLGAVMIIIGLIPYLGL